MASACAKCSPAGSPSNVVPPFGCHNTASYPFAVFTYPTLSPLTLIATSTVPDLAAPLPSTVTFPEEEDHSTGSVPLEVADHPAICPEALMARAALDPSPPWTSLSTVGLPVVDHSTASWPLEV